MTSSSQPNEHSQAVSTIAPRSLRATLPLALWLFIGCASEQAPPRAPGDVPVFTSKNTPERPYGTLGELRVDERLDEDTAMQSLRTEAVKEACDAIIMRPDGHRAICIYYTNDVAGR